MLVLVELELQPVSCVIFENESSVMEVCGCLQHRKDTRSGEVSFILK